jgi:hypothetical protein
VNVVVFVRGAAVVFWFEHPRHAELDALTGRKGYARLRARFVVCRVGTEQRLALALPRR